MQSDWKSFCADVVLDTVNMTSRDKDRILDKIYVHCHYDDYDYIYIYVNLHFRTLSYKHHNHHNDNEHIYILSKILSSSLDVILTVSKTTKTVPIRLHHNVCMESM